MSRAILALGLLMMLSGCSTFHWAKDEDDPWWAKDKAQHVSLSAATSFGATWGARAWGVPTGQAAAGGFTLTISGGALKELWDATASDGSGWSWKDFAWDLAGTAAGTWAGSVAPVPQ